MLHVALKMLMGDRTKYLGLLLGIAFTAFLVTFAGAYFAGFMTRGFALVTENPQADVWVMDPAVDATEATINLPDSALLAVRSVPGVGYAMPLALGDVDARFADGRFQSFQVIGVDDATLAGIPGADDPALASRLRAPDSVVIDPGGTSDKLRTPSRKADQWPLDGPHLGVPTRELRPGDQLRANDRQLRVLARSDSAPRFPPRPLLFTSYSNAMAILPPERDRLTFVLVSAAKGVSPQALAERISARTGLRARTAEQFKADTVRWYLINSEDVGDMVSMMLLAMIVGFGVTGVMLYMFSYENLRQYAVLSAMGAAPRQLLGMVFAQAGLCALVGTGIGVGACALVGESVALTGYPFRMMWFTPVLGMLGVLLVSVTAAAISVRPVLKLEPGMVFAGR